MRYLNLNFFHAVFLAAVVAGAGGYSPAVPAAPQDQETPEQALERINNKLKAAKTMSGELIVFSEEDKKPGMTIRFKAMSPDKYVITGVSPEFHCDGVTQWFYVPEQKQYHKTPAEKVAAVPFLVGLDSFFDPYRMSFVSLAFRELNGKKVLKAERLRRTETSPPGFVYFDLETALPIRIEDAYGSGPVTLLEYRNLKLDTPMSAAEFEFTPPAGATAYQPPDYSGQLLEAGSKAPDFTLKTPGGESVRLYDAIKGHKATILNFWFINCPACNEEFPHLQALHAELKAEGLHLVTINHGDKPQAVAQFAEKRGYDFQILLDEVDGANDLSKIYKVKGYPTNYLIGPDGAILKRFAGYKEEEMRAALKAAGIDSTK